MTDPDPTARLRLPEEPPTDGQAGQPITDTPAGMSPGTSDTSSGAAPGAPGTPGTPASTVGFAMPTTAPTSDGWSQPPPKRSRSDSGRLVTIVLGLILLGVGLWYLADVTFGIDLPTVTWSQFWPVILIAIGAWVILGSMRNARR